MILRPLSTLPPVLLSLLFLYVPHTLAADSDPHFDCRVAVDDVKFDLTQLAGARTVNQTRPTPPTTFIDSLRFDLCADLQKIEGLDDRDQCKSGTRACLTQVNQKEGEPDRIVSVIPVVEATSLGVKHTLSLSSPKFITILFEGPQYPHPATAAPTAQSLNITLFCNPEETLDPTFESYDGAQVQVAWRTKAGCPFKEGGDEDKGEKDTGPPADEGGDARSVGSGIGWFFLMLLIAFLLYFGLGAYYNYSNYGARGADLIPHRDFWKEVPYMLSDVVAHLCSSVRPRRSTNRGYIAV